MLAESSQQTVSKETVRECLKERAFMEEKIKELTVRRTTRSLFIPASH